MTTAAISQAEQLLRALFKPGDIIEFRPIETWVEDGTKKSRTDRAWRRWHTLEDINGTLELLQRLAVDEYANAFFGVNPRGASGLGKAEDIYIVRVVWIDLDGGCTPDEARHRVEESGIPLPAICVNSGHGCHLYWVLSEPINIIRGGVAVDARKQEEVEGTLTRLEKVLGADHTHNLDRIFRLPGYPNLKDARNGQKPVECCIAWCEPDRTISFDELCEYLPDDGHAASGESREAAAAEYGDQIKAILTRNGAPPPPPRASKWTAPKGLVEDVTKLLNEMPKSKAGGTDRSKADYRALAMLREAGASGAAAWKIVKGHSKFESDGKTYFDRTWNNVCEKVKVKPDASRSKDGTNITQHVAERILSEHHYARDAGGKLYVFKGGAYCPQGERHVRASVKRLLTVPDAPGCWTSHRANEVVTFIEVDARELWERPPRNRVSLLNGVLDIDARKLLQHDPKFLSSVQLPVRYDPSATCPAIDRFVNEVFPEDAIEIAYQIAAFLMLPVSHQVALLLLGSGGNGKSRYLELLRAFIGRKNTAALPLHKLESDRFAAARLMGKLANICPDLPSEHLASTAMFKAISGGDEVPAEYKFKDGFDFRPFARLVFSANSPPRSTDSSDAFFRRWVVISFDRTFEGEDLIPEQELDARLQDPAELSGLLNRALAMLPQVVKYGITVTDSMSAAWEDFRETTDGMAVWLDKHTTDMTGAMIAKDDLRKAFNDSADASGTPRMTAKSFNKALLKLRPHLTEAQRTVHGSVKWVWLGIGLRDVG